MNQHMKQRLVGLAIVFSLAVIFLPMILDGPDFEKKTLNVEIPDQPVLEMRTDFAQKMIELRAKADELPVLEPRFVDENSHQTENRFKPQTQKNQTRNNVNENRIGGDSWILQVGSFQDKEKALSQRNAIRQAQIAAVFIEQFNLDNRTNYRVRLGPFLTYEQSKIAKNKIHAKYNIDGLIMKYER